jgi:hypothetical protein
MGAFFLYKRGTDIDLEAVQACFKDKGFERFITRDLGTYTLLLYQKILIKENNFYEHRDQAIYNTGTFIYRNFSYSQSLYKFFTDFQNQQVDFNQVKGHFFLLLKSKDTLWYLRDRAGIQNIFHNTDKNVISSSFLAVIQASKKTLTMNKLAASEILCTGNLVGPDTLVQEIFRFQRNSPESFEGLEILDKIPSRRTEYCKESYEVCLENQIELLENYTLSIKSLANEYGINSGITGGLDSRLLLILFKKHISLIRFYSTWRKEKSREFLIAEKVCEKAGFKMATQPFTPTLEMTGEEFQENLEQSFLFVDGQIRNHHFWTEAINTRLYREKLLGDYRLNINGVGGEQYRNSERMLLPRWNFNNWLLFELIYYYTGDSFKGITEKKQLLEYIGRKIKKSLEMGDKAHINRLEMKRYQNELFNPSTRTLRTNIENQLAFSLSPFTEHQVSEEAYSIIPNQGLSQRFEIDMIKRLDPEIAAIETNYGYDLIKGEPLTKKCLTLVKECLPFKLYYNLYKFYKKPDNSYQQLQERFPFIREYSHRLAQAELSIDIHKIKATTLSPLIIAMGYFLTRFKKKITI